MGDTGDNTPIPRNLPGMKMLQRIDTGRIRQTVDLVELASAVTTLRKVAAREWAGPCPKCGGEDRLHVKADFWFCRQCWAPDNGKTHDAIAWTAWLYDLGFWDACKRLDDGTLSTPTAKAVPVVRKQTPGWREACWQADAQREAAAAVAELAGSRGAAARAYLVSRGVLPETWRAWGLGSGLRWNRQVGDYAAAIVLPWRQRDSIRALQYRFFGVNIEKPARFAQKAGGERGLFGLDLLLGTESLLFIEGELNAVSVWQATRGAGLDVVSFGSEGNATAEALRELARSYAHVAVWTDEAPKAAMAIASLPGARGLRSVVRAGEKLDANALLQRGILPEFLAAAGLLTFAGLQKPALACS